MVLDLQGLSGDGPFHFGELVHGLRQHQLTPVGVQNGTEEQNRAAVEAGLSVFPVWRSAPADEERDRDAVPQPAEKAADSRSTVVTRPIRSGKEVYARGGDLVVMTTVSTGAELLADGHVHVYGRPAGPGPCRGDRRPDRPHLLPGAWMPSWSRSPGTGRCARTFRKT